MIKFVALDVETTGLAVDDAICELAWAELDSELNTIRTGCSLIDPERPIPPNASAVHHITDKDVAEAPTMNEYLEHFDHPFSNSDGVIVLAHNAPFDVRFVKQHFQVVGSLCTLKLARRLYPDSPDARLATLKYYLELPNDGTFHRAAGDVFVLVHLLKRMSQDTNLDLFALYELANEPHLIEKMPFGKHKGMALKELPDSYVLWLLGLPNLSDDLRYSLQQLC